MIKTCEICAAEYDASRVNQRFCKECGKNPELARRRYIAAEIRNKENAGDRYKVREYTCKVCGKKTLSTYNRTFCSDACLQLHIVNTAKCPVCGDLLVSKGRMTGKGCCSDECTEAQRLQVAKASGRYRACKQCGEMFIAPQEQSKFCGVPCYRVWVAEKKAARPKEAPHVAARYRSCARCGKRFEVSGAGQKYCSPECRAEKPAKKAKPQGHLCTTCRTSQADCERFTTNFVYHPKGAVQKKVGGKLIVVSCPKFR